MSATTEEIKRKIDIVDLVGEYVRLNPAGGQSMKGVCPFHAEKSPSFFVHRDKQFWHCFGCSEGGDVFTFYQKIENVEFPDALKELARRTGTELPQFEAKTESDRGKLLAILEDATLFFEAALKHEVGGRARTYLDKRRLKAETLAEFRIGYAPAAWDTLVKGLVKRGHAPEKLVAAGLAIASDKGRGHYDRFRDRIMIPLRDEKGDVVGFTGRILPDSPEADKSGKYVNTPETLVYHKRRLVFGLDIAKNQIKAANFAVLVEGNLDVISSHQAGIKNVVGVSGTAFTEEQIDLLKRYGTRIALAFDADPAGQSAAAKALPHAWRSGMQVLVVTLPDGLKDPDEVINKDPELWRKAIADAKDMIEYSVSKALTGLQLQDPFSKKRSLAMLKPVFDLLDDSVLYDHWTHVLAERLFLTDEAVKEALAAGRKVRREEKPALTVAAPVVESREEQLATRFFSLILSEKKLFQQHIPILQEEWIPQGSLRTLAKSLKAYYTKTDTSALEPRGFFSSYDVMRSADPALPALEPILLLKERDMADWTDEQLNEETSLCMQELEKSARKRNTKELLGALGEAERRGDTEAVKTLAKRLEEMMNPFRGGSASFKP